MDWSTCFKDKKVLIAEDDELSREMMSDIFELMHCSADFAIDGNQVVEKYKNKAYDLILMDVRMPNKDGISATKEIRGIEDGGRRVPIIALTASLLNEDRQSCVEAGVDDFINKPIHLEELRKKLARYLLGQA